MEDGSIVMKGVQMCILNSMKLSKHSKLTTSYTQCVKVTVINWCRLEQCLLTQNEACAVLSDGVSTRMAVWQNTVTEYHYNTWCHKQISSVK